MIRVFFLMGIVFLLGSCASSFQQKKFQRGYRYSEQVEFTSRSPVTKTRLINNDEKSTVEASTLTNSEINETFNIKAFTHMDDEFPDSNFLFNQKVCVEELLLEPSKETKSTSKLTKTEKKKKREPSEKRAFRYNNVSNLMLVLFLVFLALTIAFAILAMDWFLLPAMLGVGGLLFPTVLHSVFRNLSIRNSTDPDFRKKGKRKFWAILITYLSLILALVVLLLIVMIF